MFEHWIPGISSGSGMGQIAPQEETAPMSREPLPPCTAVGLERVERLTAAAWEVLRPGKRSMGADAGQEASEA